MLGFEERYGGNPMEYGLDGVPQVSDTPYGPAFAGIVDGPLTWGLDVLLNGRTAMGPGRRPYRIVDRSLIQRLERHALLHEVRGWFHQAFECLTPSFVGLVAEEQRLPPAVPEATGPAELWWGGSDVAVQAKLAGRHPPGPAVLHETVPVTWCTLCSEDVAAGRPCNVRRRSPRT